ncbi:hypothetical protein CCR94_16745 [Rhodoblastus sphagnicola]|uniref:Uncharacterized protein n=1 Tax=Rhodoblastus sphagnicola TaxID=333368 RepID=A0A2S6N2T7_9HYPH|nr:hypothetical protein [Rhodoblastus sphagnicola]MBB4198226.1 hypothetical protein [Rhodoblastus sphagnicola]PPQ28912.1 hypothetical protein CCR94_16745 [Rhodoblastus sphagnicola]
MTSGGAGDGFLPFAGLARETGVVWRFALVWRKGACLSAAAWGWQALAMYALSGYTCIFYQP